MIIFPECKINVGLNIKAKRPDGYHELSTVMVPVDWCDILEIVPARGAHTTLKTIGRKLDCAPEDNLVMRAYNKLKDAVGGNLPPVDIYLEKIIPDGAGLGGGSSDASHLLLALNEMFELNMSLNELASIASTLGADCPLFIYNVPMLGTGTGTTLTPVEVNLRSYTILIIKPPVHISTSRAYAGVKPAEWGRPIESMTSDLIGSQPTNDFEPGIFNEFPQLAELKELITYYGAVYSSMSGSGSSIYGMFEDKSKAQECAKRLEGKGIIHICHAL